MGRHLYLADLFRSGGLNVIEYPDWETRGSSRFAPAGVVEHVTVTGPKLSDQRAADLLANGRPDLPGPLSQTGTARNGDVWLIAAGRCNHNGYGYGGNDMFGNEMFNDGYDEPITAAQMWSSLVQAALLVEHNGYPIGMVLGHKETDPKRKIDPRSIWMPGFRASVLDIITTGGDMSQADIDHIMSELDQIKGHVKTTADELFHFAEINEPVPQTGQRKTQLWRLFQTGKRLDDVQLQINTLGESVQEIKATQAKILAAVTPPPQIPTGR